MSANTHEILDPQIASWRAHLLAQGSAERDVNTAEAELRDHAATLMGIGLDAEEAFLVALKPAAAAGNPYYYYAQQ